MSNFLTILKDIFRFFEKFNRNFRQNLGKNLENFGNMGLQGVRGAEPPEASDNIKKSIRKITGNLQNFENFHEFLANFDLKKLILIKIEPNLMEF